MLKKIILLLLFATQINIQSSALRIGSYLTIVGLSYAGIKAKGKLSTGFYFGVGSLMAFIMWYHDYKKYNRFVNASKKINNAYGQLYKKIGEIDSNLEKQQQDREKQGRLRLTNEEIHQMKLQLIRLALCNFEERLIHNEGTHIEEHWISAASNDICKTLYEDFMINDFTIELQPAMGITIQLNNGEQNYNSHQRCTDTKNSLEPFVEKYKTKFIITNIVSLAPVAAIGYATYKALKQ